MTIQYFDALAGAGKTYALVKYADDLARKDEKILFVQPSKLLINNTIKDEVDGLNPIYPVKAIHGDTDRNVVASIIRHLRLATVGGEIVFITHEAFMRLPIFEGKRKWTVLFDEVPQVDIYQHFNIADTHQLLTANLMTTDSGNGYCQLLDNLEVSKLGLTKIANNKRQDELLERLQPLARRIKSQDWKVYVRPEQYENLLTGDKDTNQLATHSLLHPSIFDYYKHVIIAGALFKESVLFNLWSRLGWTNIWSCNKSLYQNLRYQTHQNGDLITINYLLDGSWSKSMRDKTFMNPETGETDCLNDYLGKFIGNALAPNPFVWMGNNDLADDYFDQAIAERLPNSPHGLNNFQYYNHAVIISALNPPPAHFKFMAVMGIEEDELRTHHYRNAVYQAAMRISIRNPNDTNLKSITVMDATTAHWLATIFTGAKVQPLAGFNIPIAYNPSGRPRQYADNAEKQKAYRAAKKLREKELHDEMRNVNGLNLPANLRPLLDYGTAFNSIYSTEVLTRLDLDNDETFIELLRDIYKRQIASKHENYLFSPAHFDTNKHGVETKRGKDNICYMRGIWLDNDGGDLTYDTFAKIFADLKLVVWNTYSSTNENPRWRCYIPTTQVMGIETYACIIQQMMQRLEHYGYLGTTAHQKRKGGKRHGFDEGKFAPNSLFYAPCQAADPQGSFFKEYNQANRKALDPFTWIDNDTRRVVLPPQPVALVSNDNTIKAVLASSHSINPNQAKIASAIATWRSTPKGEGHKAFFTLGAKLKAAKMTTVDIEQTLRTEARYAQSPRQRFQDIKSVMKSLERPSIGNSTKTA